MIAFVMSGGGSRGALQAGAIFALREAGIVPDFVVGSSVGALNALHLACHGLDEPGLTKLRKTWEKVHKRNVFPATSLVSAFRFLQGKDSLHGGSALRKFVTRQVPKGMKTFGDLLMPCYLTATDLRSQRLYLFGESADSEFLDAALASASIPVLHPPIPYQDLQLVDGGVLDNVPAEVAMDKGALEIWVLNVGYGGQRLQAAKGDVTRVVTFQLSREASNRTYTEIGVPDPHHPTSHHGNDPAKLAMLAKINQYHVSLFGYFLEKLAEVPDGDGSLLDHSLYLYGSGMGNPNVHDHTNLPVVVAGGGAGRSKGGRHLKYAEPEPMANLHLALLDAVGVRLDKFADSTRRIETLLDPLSLAG